MADPLSMLGHLGTTGAAAGAGASGAPAARGAESADGRRFEQELLAELSRQIDEVNVLQGDADRAAEDLATGRRADVEGVMIATQKADTAFRMLLAVRNRMMEAYEEVKQIRI